MEYVSIQEVGQLVIPDIPVSMTASTAVTSTYVNATDADVVECILFLAVSAAGATSVGKIEVVAASDASGTGAVAVNISDLWYTIGATTIKTGTGVPARVEMTTNSVRTPAAYYNTLAADGDKQQLYVVPVRSRHLPAGKPYVAVRFTAGSATARNGQVMFIRRKSGYGQKPMLTSIFA